MVRPHPLPWGQRAQQDRAEEDRELLYPSWPAAEDLPARSGRRGNAGRVEVFVFAWQQTLWTDGLEYYHVLQQRAPSGTGVVQRTVLLLLRSGHYSLPHNFQALVTSHAHQQRRLRGVQVPEVHGPLRQEGLLAAAPRLLVER